MAVEEFAEGVAGQQGDIAICHQDRAGQVAGEVLEGAFGGPAGALDLVLVGDERPRDRRSATWAATRSRSCRTTTARWRGPVARAAAIAWPSRLRPPMRWRTFGVADFILVPSPAARMTTAAGVDPVTFA
jgi:hypothetical protein